MTNNKANPQTSEQQPKPDPAVRRFDVLIGTWDLKVRMLDSDEDNMTAGIHLSSWRVDFFLNQKVKLTLYEAPKFRNHCL